MRRIVPTAPEDPRHSHRARRESGCCHPTRPESALWCASARRSPRTVLRCRGPPGEAPAVT